MQPLWYTVACHRCTQASPGHAQATAGREQQRNASELGDPGRRHDDATPGRAPRMSAVVGGRRRSVHRRTFATGFVVANNNVAALVAYETPVFGVLRRPP